MNLQDHRQGLIDQVDWDIQSSASGIALIDRFINRALNQVALDAPFLFFEERFMFDTQPDAETAFDDDGVAIDRIQIVADVTAGANPWVFEVEALRGTPGMNEWPTDRSWDGRFIEIITEDGVRHKNRIRTVYQEGQSLAVRLTVWHPWNVLELDEGPFRWRVYTQEYFIPDDVLELRSIRIINEDRPFPLRMGTQGEAEALGLAEHSPEGQADTPTVAFRSRHEQMRGPAQPILINVQDEDAPWNGPEPPGKFQYIATFCWGKRHADWQNPGAGYWAGGADPWYDITTVGPSVDAVSRLRFREPMWESAPGPTSSVYEVLPVDGGQNPDSPGIAPTLYLPNIEYAQGFMLQVQSDDNGGTLYTRIHSRHSGWYVRIYRRRLSYDTGSIYHDLGDGLAGESIPSLYHMEYDDAYYLLMEVPVDYTNAGVFVDDGQILPDMNRRLRDINGYQSIRLWPQPDQRYVIDVRAVRRPKKLVDASDASPVHAEAADLITQRATAFMYEKLHDTAGQAAAIALYDRQLAQIKKRYGLGVPSDQVVRTYPTRWPPVFSASRWRP